MPQNQNVNPNPNAGKPNPAPQPKQNQKPEALIHNTLGLQPTAVEFQMSADQLCDAIYQIASTYLPLVKSCTYHPAESQPIVAFYLWFDHNCEYFVDKSTERNWINQATNRISPEFNEFGKKFGWCEAAQNPKDGSNKVNVKACLVNNQEREAGKLKGFHISILPFLEIMLDRTGADFGSKYGKNAPSMKMNVHYDFAQGPRGKFQYFNGVILRKELAAASRFGRRAKPSPRKPGRFN